jgi:hypothetical protein
MPSSTNSASNGSLSRPPQRGDFCGIAFWLSTVTALTISLNTG